MEYWQILLICVIFSSLSFIHTTVGFGGGSSYMAVLAVMAINVMPFQLLPFQEIRLISLLCSLALISGSSFIYLFKKKEKLKKTYPIILISIPFAFFAGRVILAKDEYYYMILGFALLAEGYYMWKQNVRIKREGQYPIPMDFNYFRETTKIGFIGILTGLIGEVGTPFMSPILHKMHWGTPKRIAATINFLVLVNGIAAIAGQQTVYPGKIHFLYIVFFIGAVLVGKHFGSKYVIRNLHSIIVKRVSAILIFLVGLEILQRTLPWF